MNRQSPAARIIVETVDALTVVDTNLIAANDNDDENFDALAHEMVAILLRDGRALLAG